MRTLLRLIKAEEDALGNLGRAVTLEDLSGDLQAKIESMVVPEIVTKGLSSIKDFLAQF